MQTRRAFVTVMLAGLTCSSLPAAAQQDPAALAQRLEKDLDPALVPPGYQFIISQPAAMSDDDRRQNMAASVNLLLEKTAGTKESIYYYIFGSTAQAAAYEPTWEDTIGSFGAQMRSREIDTKSRRFERRIESATAMPTLHCRAMDGFISCLMHYPRSAVVIHLVLQEPGLNEAADDKKRTAVVAARLEREADGLLKAARMHLAAALR